MRRRHLQSIQGSGVTLYGLPVPEGAVMAVLAACASFLAGYALGELRGSHANTMRYIRNLRKRRAE